MKKETMQAAYDRLSSRINKLVEAHNNLLVIVEEQDKQLKNLKVVLKLFLGKLNDK